MSEDPVPAQASAKNANPDRAPSGRLRKKITEPSSSSSSEDSASSSEVEYPVEGCHTDAEQDNLSDGLSTPIVIRTVSAPSFESQPKENLQPIPSQAYHRIPKKKKTKKSKKAKKSERSQPKKTRVSSKKNKKHKAKKSRRFSPPPASSTSSEESGSDSEDNFQAPAPADQVLALEAQYYLYITILLVLLLSDGSLLSFPNNPKSMRSPFEILGISWVGSQLRSFFF